MPKAYVVCDIDVTNPDGYAEYRALANVAGEKYGATYLARGGATTVLEGDWEPNRLVVLEFDNEAAAQRWWESSEYEAAKAVRRANATSSFVLVAGV